MTEQVLEAIDGLQEPVTRGDIAKAIGASQQEVDSVIAQLNAQGKIVIRNR